MRLRVALQHQAEPVFTSATTTIPAASVWTGSRHWARAFRKAGLVAHDTLGIDLVAGPAFVQILVAALSNEYQVCFGDDILSAHIVITSDMVNGITGPACDLVMSCPPRANKTVPARSTASTPSPSPSCIRNVGAVVPNPVLANDVVVVRGPWMSVKTVEDFALVPILSGAAQVVFA